LPTGLDLRAILSSPARDQDRDANLAAALWNLDGGFSVRGDGLNYAAGHCIFCHRGTHASCSCSCQPPSPCPDKSETEEKWRVPAAGRQASLVPRARGSTPTCRPGSRLPVQAAGGGMWMRGCYRRLRCGQSAARARGEQSAHGWMGTVDSAGAGAVGMHCMVCVPSRQRRCSDGDGRRAAAVVAIDDHDEAVSKQGQRTFFFFFLFPFRGKLVRKYAQRK